MDDVLNSAEHFKVSGCIDMEKFKLEFLNFEEYIAV
jgi:hypothetical protein